MKQFKAKWQDADARDLTDVHTAVIKTVGHLIAKHNALCDYLEEQQKAKTLKELDSERWGNLGNTLTLKKPLWWSRYLTSDERSYQQALNDVSNALGITINLE